MKTRKLPKIDSIRKLAKFWDAHDLTDFEDELEEVSDPIFVRKTLINVELNSGESVALRKLARNNGVSEGELIRKWILPKLAAVRMSHATKGNGKK